MKQFMQMRTDQNAFGSYNPLDVKEAAKVYFHKGDQGGQGNHYGNLIAALNGFDPNGQSMFAGQQSEIWKFSSNYNPNENVHKYVSESTDVGSLGSIKTPEGGLNQGGKTQANGQFNGGLNQGGKTHANGQFNGGLNQGITGQSHPNGQFNANALNNDLMTGIDKQTFRPGIGLPSTFSSSMSSISGPGAPAHQLSSATQGEPSFNPNQLNHELFQNLGYNPEAVNSETTALHHGPLSLTGPGESGPANVNNLGSGPAEVMSNHQNGGIHGAMTQDGGTNQNHGAAVNGVGTTNHNGGVPTTGNGQTSTQNGGTGTQHSGTAIYKPLNGGTGTQNGGTAIYKPQNGGTIDQNGGATQAGGSSHQNGGTATQNGGTPAGNGETGSGDGSTDQPRYHIVLNSEGQHVLVQETDTPGKFVAIKTISNEKLANYLIGKLSSVNTGSAVPKSLSVFLSAQRPFTQTQAQPEQPIVGASPATDNVAGYTGVDASQQSETLGMDQVHATGIGELGGGQVGRLPSVSGMGSSGTGLIDQVNTNPYVSATGIGTLGSNELTQRQGPGASLYATGMGSLGSSGPRNGSE